MFTIARGMYCGRHWSTRSWSTAISVHLAGRETDVSLVLDSVAVALAREGAQFEAGESGRALVPGTSLRLVRLMLRRAFAQHLPNSTVLGLSFGTRDLMGQRGPETPRLCPAERPMSPFARAPSIQLQLGQSVNILRPSPWSLWHSALQEAASGHLQSPEWRGLALERLFADAEIEREATDRRVQDPPALRGTFGLFGATD